MMSGVLYLREDDIDGLVSVADAVGALESAFGKLAAGDASVRPRQRVRAPGGLLHVMPAGIAGGNSLGLKVYSTFAGSGARFFIMLFDARTGELRALMQADRLGQIRTGAASGLATKLMARSESSVLGLIGAGWQARTQLLAVCSVRPIRTVRLYCRDARHREAFCSEMRELVDAEIIPVSSARESVEGSDVVVTITSSAEPVLEGRWLSPGTHINAAGSNQAAKRELDDATMLRASRIVVDLREQATMECGDLIPLVNSGRLRWADVAELADVVSGAIPGRTNPEDITLFESQGIALEDMAVASLAYERAMSLGVETTLEL